MTKHNILHKPKETNITQMLKSDISLTGIEDTDRQILFHIDDNELFNACYISNYYNGLCNSKFWFQKFCQVFEANLNEYENIDYRKLYKQLRSMTDVDILYFATERGYLPLLKVMLKGFIEKDVSDVIDKLFLWAAKYGQLNVLMYLFHLPERDKSDIQNKYNEALIKASDYGKLNIIKYLVSDEFITERNYCPKYSIIYFAYKRAIQLGYLDIVKYLALRVQVAPHKEFIDAVQYGHLDIVKYFVEGDPKSPQMERANIFTSYNLAFQRAISSGSVSILHYLMGKVATYDETVTIWKYNFKQLPIAANNGHLDVIQYLIKTNESSFMCFDINKYKKKALKYAEANHQHHVVTYLTENIAKNIN